MTSRGRLRRSLVALVLGVLVGGGLMAVTPAGADVQQAVSKQWKKIWKKQLRPQADARYYTKKKARKRFVKQSALDAYETAAAAGAKYQPKGNYALNGSSYTKAEIDAKLAPLINSVAATSGGNQDVDLTVADQVVRSVSLMPPADGTVIVSASAYVRNDGAGAMVSRCSISPGDLVDFNFLQFIEVTEPGDSEVVAGTRGFAATKGSLLTVNYVCDLVSGSAGVRDSSLTAVFAPS